MKGGETFRNLALPHSTRSLAFSASVAVAARYRIHFDDHDLAIANRSRLLLEKRS